MKQFAVERLFAEELAVFHVIKIPFLGVDISVYVSLVIKSVCQLRRLHA